MQKKMVQLDKTNLWFRKYLTNRTQYKIVRDFKSSCKEILCGGPQGPVLGPLLFLLYIDDLPDSTSFFTSLFADNTGFLKSSNYLEILFLMANHELSEVSSWFQANKLTLNASKSKYIVFRNKSMQFED